MDEPSKAIPTLRQFLGDGGRSDDFEDMQAQVRDLLTAYPDVSGETRVLVRFMQAISIACVEVARQESGDGSPEQVVSVMRQMISGGAVAISAAALSVLSDTVPAETFRTYVTDLFETGLSEVIRSNGLK